MPADLVNLRQFRKRKARAQKEKTAEQNRIAHGRSKAEMELTARLNDQHSDRHAQKRLDKPGKRAPKPSGQ